MDRWFARRGESTVAVARVLPAVRSYISYPAGTARMDPTRFGLYTLLGSIPWTLALLYAGIVLRSNWTVVEQYFRPIDIALLVAVVGLVVYLGLVAAGVVSSGWPPRRGPRYARVEETASGVTPTPSDPPPPP
jgi:membrane protein DedA with SNARE-associated domain